MMFPAPEGEVRAKLTLPVGMSAPPSTVTLAVMVSSVLYLEVITSSEVPLELPVITPLGDTAK